MVIQHRPPLLGNAVSVRNWICSYSLQASSGGGLSGRLKAHQAIVVVMLSASLIERTQWSNFCRHLRDSDCNASSKCDGHRLEQSYMRTQRRHRGQSLLRDLAMLEQSCMTTQREQRWRDRGVTTLEQSCMRTQREQRWRDRGVTMLEQSCMRTQREQRWRARGVTMTRAVVYHDTDHKEP